MASKKRTASTAVETDSAENVTTITKKKSRTLTEEQQAIVAAVKSEPGLVKVQACAGSGKSFTLAQTLKEQVASNPTGRVLVVGFANVTIKNVKADIDQDFEEFDIHQNTSGLFASTLHKIGSALLGGTVRVDSAAAIASAKTALFDKEPKEVSRLGLKLSKLLSPLLNATGWQEELLEWQKLPDEQNKFFEELIADEKPQDKNDLRKYICPALKVYVKHSPFESLLLQPIRFNKKAKVDLLAVDEAQDLTKLQWQFVFKTLVDRDTRVIILGDQYQAIYGFNGVDEDRSLATIPVSEYRGVLAGCPVKELSISECYRCPATVIACAQQLVGDSSAIRAHGGAVPGTVRQQDFDITDLDAHTEVLESLQPGDLILCRQNNSLFKLAFACAALPTPKPVGISTSASVKREMLAVCDEALRAGLSNLSAIDDTLERRVNTLKREAAKSQNFSESSKAGYFRKELKAFVTAGQEAGCFSDIKGLQQHIEEMVYAIDEAGDGEEDEDDVFKLSKGTRVYFSTVFKSKGLGAHRVFWVTGGSRKSNTAAAERNLSYVAVTRCKDSLTFLGPNPCSPQL